MISSRNGTNRTGGFPIFKSAVNQLCGGAKNEGWIYEMNWLWLPRTTVRNVNDWKVTL